MQDALALIENGSWAVHHDLGDPLVVEHSLQGAESEHLVDKALDKIVARNGRGANPNGILEHLSASAAQLVFGTLGIRRSDGGDLLDRDDPPHLVAQHVQIVPIAHAPG